MSGLLQQVWAAAYAAEFARERAFRMQHGLGSIDDISGFACAEVADVAVDKLVEALDGEDRGYLQPHKSGWKR